MPKTCFGKNHTKRSACKILNDSFCTAYDRTDIKQCLKFLNNKKFYQEKDCNHGKNHTVNCFDDPSFSNKVRWKIKDAAKYKRVQKQHQCTNRRSRLGNGLVKYHLLKENTSGKKQKSQRHFHSHRHFIYPFIDFVHKSP